MILSLFAGYHIGGASTDEENSGQMEKVNEIEDDDRTPVLSRENSNVHTKPVAPVWRRKCENIRSPTEESDNQNHHMHRPLSRASPGCSRRAKSNGTESAISRHTVEFRSWREIEKSPPCRRRIQDGSPASNRRSMIAEGSPASVRKSLTFENSSPVSARKNSNVSLTPSVRSDSTLHSSAADGAPNTATENPKSPNKTEKLTVEKVCLSPESLQSQGKSTTHGGFQWQRKEVSYAPLIKPVNPIAACKNSVKAETSNVFSMRKKDPETPSAWRKDLETGLLSPVLRRKESVQHRRESFRRQKSEPCQSSIANAFQKYSFTDDRIWHLPNSTNRRSIGATDLKSRPIQMPVITSPILRPSNLHKKNQQLARHASERIPSEHQNQVIKEQLNKTTKSDVAINKIRGQQKPKIDETQNLRLLRSMSDSHTDAELRLAKQSSESSIGNDNGFECFVGSASEKLSAASSSPLDSAASSQKRDTIHQLLRERKSVGMNNNARIRKKNRSILMESLEVNWSVDELKAKFQNGSGPPPRLDTAYSICAMK